MAKENNAASGNISMLILKLLEEKDMYGYQIIEELARRSENVFHLKTGTLYPILHNLENEGIVLSYEENADNQRVRRYYQLTSHGRGLLAKKQFEWREYTKAVNRIMERGTNYVLA